MTERSSADGAGAVPRAGDGPAVSVDGSARPIGGGGTVGGGGSVDGGGTVGGSRTVGVGGGARVGGVASVGDAAPVGVGGVAGVGGSVGVGGVAGVGGSVGDAPSVIVGRDGRAKAYRPLPAADRAAAIAAGLAAYDRGDFFLAHEDLEPAWMGTADLGERAVLQGLIKVAAAYVHAVRGNPAGIERNLTGARRRLTEPGATEAAVSLDGLDLAGLIDDIDRRLADLGAHPTDPRLGPPILRRSVP